MSKIYIYNTLTGKKEEFIPLNPDEVKIYVCGITPYDEPHLGHARCYVVFDTIRRILEFQGYKVIYVQNFTDIDDKIINRAKRENKSWDEISNQYIQNYFEVMDALNVKRANFYPRVSQHIQDIIETIEKLITKGYAYVSDGDVYYSIDKFKDYGKLSHRSKEEMRSGARVEPEKNKKNPLDFALWKQSLPSEPGWVSPWSYGRAGWHIECSVMSIKYLGQPIDIHGGGQDLIFPHHENEIAQVEALSETYFAKYWVHNGFVYINKEKMSKSLGNFFTVSEVLKKYSPSTIRLFLLTQHYRSPLDFSLDKIQENQQALEKIYNLLDRIEFIENKVKKVCENKKFVEFDQFEERFFSSLKDDFNTAQAVGIIFELLNFLNKEIANSNYNYDFLNQGKQIFLKFFQTLGIVLKPQLPPLKKEEIEELIKEREKARERKDWVKADELREKLSRSGVIVEDTPLGPRWKILQ